MNHHHRYPNHPGFKATETSSATADRIATHASTLRDRVHAFLCENYPASFTADEVADRLRASILSVRPRVTELRRSGLIEATAERRLNASGMRAICWRAKVTP